ncbi:MAG: DUF1593 domain-containing protein [Massilia sp.]
MFVLTDIANEPDDEESMVRFLVYANQYDIEGLVATTSTFLREKPREDLIRRQLDAYAEVRDNLLIHEPGFPSKEQLLAVTATGQTAFGMAAVGSGKTTAGSQLLLAAADKADARPLWVTVWGGSNTLAQALSDARARRTPEEMARLIAKLKVYSISDQDDAGQWMRREFPALFWIVSPSNPTSPAEYWRATWTGISGDRFYKNGSGHLMDMVDHPWLEKHIRSNHGALGALYPQFAYIMEGDTPSFLGLIDNGLGWSVDPSYGGWGGRYALFQAYGETRRIWTNTSDSRDCVSASSGVRECSDQATVWRWREHFQNDFAARMDWCVAPAYDKANHNPLAVLNGDRSKKVIALMARPNTTLSLSAAGTSDPDGNKLALSWSIYEEAGSDVRALKDVQLSATSGEALTLTIPNLKQAARLHVILQVEDDGNPKLVAYRRAIISVQP